MINNRLHVTTTHDVQSPARRITHIQDIDIPTRRYIIIHALHENCISSPRSRGLPNAGCTAFHSAAVLDGQVAGAAVTADCQVACPPVTVWADGQVPAASPANAPFDTGGMTARIKRQNALARTAYS